MAVDKVADLDFGFNFFQTGFTLYKICRKNAADFCLLCMENNFVGKTYELFASYGFIGVIKRGVHKIFKPIDFV